MYPVGNLFIPAPHGQLEAILKEPKDVEPRGVALCCHPHPLGGGTMHNKVVFRAAAGLNDAGLVALRFNFRGVGQSTGTHDEGRGEKEDVKTALDYLAENYPDQEITLAGFSFGSRTGIEVGMNDKRVARLISLGTPVDKYKDYDFLKAVKKPILFLHGDKDEFGSIETLRPLVESLPPEAEAKLIVFENCGHFFDEHLNELRDAIKTWTDERIRNQK
ncbi:MAG TPA: alpha/beta fold hydrolase [Pyrinomonadaceae bacterium]|nr:alpha/beta fold hydrolase [Pyrinomonadaceae bacterium]